VIIARGNVSAEELTENTMKLIEDNVPGVAKIIDVESSPRELIHGSSAAELTWCDALCEK